MGVWDFGSFCRKNLHAHKIPLFRGYCGFFLGGGANFIFMGAGILQKKIETLRDVSGIGPDFLRKVPAVLGGMAYDICALKRTH